MATTVVDLEVPEGKSIIHTLDKSGDTRLIWDRSNQDEISAARKMFNELTAKQFVAYKAEGKEGKKGEVIRTFDESAERIIMVPRMVGG